MTARERYLARMRRVIDHIEAQADAIDPDLGLSALAEVAAFSKFHFHRQFAAHFGVSLARYVQHVRLKRAAHRLAYRPGERVTAIALDAGYGSSDAFARAFKRQFGQAPSAFRENPDWARWQSAERPFSRMETQHMQTQFTGDDVAIVDTPDIDVAILTHRGDPRTIGETIRRFIDWRRKTGIRPPESATYTIFHSDPQTTPVAEQRTDLCAGIARPLAENDVGVTAGKIPGGRCAMLRITGPAENLEPAASWLYREWLPASGEELRDFPIYCRRIAFYPDVPAHAAQTELYLPLA